MTRTTAQAISILFDDNGSVFEVSGISLDTECRSYQPDITHDVERDATRYQFADGSSIVIAGDGWDLGLPADQCPGGFCWDSDECRCERTTECAYCGADVSHGDAVPHTDDQWAEFAREHRMDCEWILTRAHSCDTETATKIWEANYGDPATDTYWVQTTLYRTPDGGWFAVGSVGIHSSYSLSRDKRYAFRALSQSEALAWCEEHNVGDETISKYFEIEDA